ncbi:MAG: hypothetical protein LAT78_12335 [Roseinatronobacter sp.]|nr:hypothetical protein [Roseinatronobacter sp.]
MSRMDHFRQGGTPFDGFLYADLGQDDDGNTVSVLSALARLGRDPWDEAAELSVLSNAAAQTRLEQLLSRFADVPEDNRNPRATIPRLVALLPAAFSPTIGAGSLLKTRAKLPGVGPLIAVVMVALFLVQRFLLGSDGSGD